MRPRHFCKKCRRRPDRRPRNQTVTDGGEFGFFSDLMHHAHSPANRPLEQKLAAEAPAGTRPQARGARSGGPPLPPYANLQPGAFQTFAGRSAGRPLSPPPRVNLPVRFVSSCLPVCVSPVPSSSFPSRFPIIFFF